VRLTNAEKEAGVTREGKRLKLVAEGKMLAQSADASNSNDDDDSE
jgi:hypothetical protein